MCVGLVDRFEFEPVTNQPVRDSRIYPYAINIQKTSKKVKIKKS